MTGRAGLIYGQAMFNIPRVPKAPGASLTPPASGLGRCLGRLLAILVTRGRWCVGWSAKRVSWLSAGNQLVRGGGILRTRCFDTARRGRVVGGETNKKKQRARQEMEEDG
jgi:hypothetical protein